ncbi:MAG: SAM hydrolase/SAM-dependent halogenase family protein [Pirellulales bacterium]|jgi:S-adenosylmethionine hydrolase
MQRIVTLTTDFGSGSVYVAQVKARLLQARTPCTIVDLAHDLPAHDIRGASWFLAQACLVFPQGSLHLAVIDPGVGTARHIVWASLGGHQFLAPDNGLLTHALAAAPLDDARVLPVPTAASATFHGRDIVAATACQLLEGQAPTSLGTPLTSLVQLGTSEPTRVAEGIRGEVCFIDHFGNLLTNLPATMWPTVAAAGGLFLGERWIDQPVRTYGDAARGSAVVLIGSQGVIEIAVVEGSAARLLGGELGTPVTLHEQRT